MTQAISNPGRGPAEPRVRCACWAVFVFDIGLGIDLKRAEPAMRASRERGDPVPAEPHRGKPTPSYFQFTPAPVRAPRRVDPVTIGGFTSAPRADIVLYDFGAATIAYRLEYDGPISGLLPLADALYDGAPLRDAGKAEMSRVFEEIRGAITRPSIAPLIEDYVLYQFVSGPGAGEIGDPAGFIAAHGPLLARVLRAEPRELSEQEVRDALANRISYTPGDAVVIDWNAAALFTDDPDDVRRLLEFANVELLEMRQLDDQLDAALESVALAGQPKPGSVVTRLFGGSRGPDLDRVAELQSEGSLLFENVNNALKLVGDQYLARLYRLAAARLHLAEWDATILRKLNTLESIYQKLSDRQSALRMEILEWIVILLIAFEVVMALVGGR